MQVEVMTSIENPLLQRKEITAKLSDFTATPSQKEVTEALCGMLSVKPDLLVITKIEQKTGRKTALVKAKLYASPEARKAVEKTKTKNEPKKQG